MFCLLSEFSACTISGVLNSNLECFSKRFVVVIANSQRVASHLVSRLLSFFGDNGSLQFAHSPVRLLVLQVRHSKAQNNIKFIIITIISLFTHCAACTCTHAVIHIMETAAIFSQGWSTRICCTLIIVWPGLFCSCFVNCSSFNLCVCVYILSWLTTCFLLFFNCNIFIAVIVCP